MSEQKSARWMDLRPEVEHKGTPFAMDIEILENAKEVVHSMFQSVHVLDIMNWVSTSKSKKVIDLRWYSCV